MAGDPVTADAIPSVSSSDFDRVVLKAAGPVAVEFMSYSCAHCRAIEAALQQVAQALAPQQLVVRVNVALEAELAARHGVQGTPTLLMFRHGSEIARIKGPPHDAASLLAAVRLAFEPP